MIRRGSPGGLTRHLLGSHLLIALLVFVLTAWVAYTVFERFHRSEMEHALRVRAILVADVLDEAIRSGDRDELLRQCRAIGRRVDARITVIAPAGEVLADSRGNPANMDNHADRPEIRRAREAGIGAASRRSDTLRRTLLYVAHRVGEDGPVVRLAVAETAMARARARMLRQTGWIGLAPVLLAAGLSVYAGRRVTRPLRRAVDGARRFAAGDLDVRLPRHGPAEVAELTDALNTMAETLAARIRDVQNEREEATAILASMSEGVIAVDRDERVITVNRAASRLVRVSPEPGSDRPTMQEVLRDAGLLRFLSRILAGEDELTAELAVLAGDGSERILLAHGSVLRDPARKPAGALAVLQDISRLRRLEMMRREFVANVSHELKTPVTSIQGFVETLRDGAIDEPAEARRFLEIIHRQTRRIHVIIQDLLTLSRLEEAAGSGDLRFERILLRPVLGQVVQLCEAVARERAVTLAVKCPDDLTARMNVPLVEQAVFNLAENAIKYGREGGRVLVRAEAAERGTRIRVTDEGEGIASEHLERIFERFYRVDRARSRERGGSGLGLSIVKHIAHAHGGWAAAESTVGAGSTIILFLPDA